MALKKIILRYCTGQLVGFDTTDPETEIPIEPGELPSKLALIEENFPPPYYSDHYSPNTQGLAQYEWDRVAIPS